MTKKSRKTLLSEDFLFLSLSKRINYYQKTDPKKFRVLLFQVYTADQSTNTLLHRTFIECFYHPLFIFVC